MSAKHTPGPWKTTTLGRVVSRECIVAMVGDYSDKELLKFNKNRWEADARLIAAAPKMFDALEAIDNWARTCSPVDLIKNLDPVMAQARSAIAAARGEE